MLKRLVIVAGLLLALASCGGGGGGAGGGGGGSVPPPAPSLTVSLSSLNSSASGDEGADTVRTFTFDATVTVSGNLSTPVVADLNYDNTFFSSVTATSVGNVYTINATTHPDLGGGPRTSPIRFRLCQQTACDAIYAGSTVTHTVSFAIKLKEWTTFQRNASHTGYVHAKLDSSKFAKAWEWSTPHHGRFGGIVPVNGAVYVTTGIKAFRLSEAAGAQAWEYTGPQDSNWMGPPAVQGGAVYFPTLAPRTGPVFTGSANIRGLNTTTGVLETESPFQSQSDTFNSATFYEGSMYFSAGYYGNVAYRYELPSGSVTWNPFLPSGYAYQQSPAVDQNYIYHAAGNGLIIVNRSDGSLFAKVPSAPGGSGAITGPSAPVITANGLVLTADITDNNKLIAINPATKAIAWRGPTIGGSQPVTAGNIIYSPTYQSGAQVSAIDAVNGMTQWSWSLPVTDNQFISNMILTDNLLFLSTDKKIYAVDLTTHQTVWTYPIHGSRLALSSDLMLYVFQSDYGVTETRVTAIRLAV